MEKLLILGLQKVTFKGKDGNDVVYYEMYCLGSECNVCGNRVITYLVSNQAIEDFKKRNKLQLNQLAEKHIADKTVTITASHKLKITSFSVE